MWYMNESVNRLKHKSKLSSPKNTKIMNETIRYFINHEISMEGKFDKLSDFNINQLNKQAMVDII